MQRSVCVVSEEMAGQERLNFVSLRLMCGVSKTLDQRLQVSVVRWMGMWKKMMRQK